LIRLRDDDNDAVVSFRNPGDDAVDPEQHGIRGCVAVARLLPPSTKAKDSSVSTTTPSMLVLVVPLVFAVAAAAADSDSNWFRSVT